MREGNSQEDRTSVPCGPHVALLYPPSYFSSIVFPPLDLLRLPQLLPWTSFFGYFWRSRFPENERQRVHSRSRGTLQVWHPLCLPHTSSSHRVHFQTWHTLLNFTLTKSKGRCCLPWTEYTAECSFFLIASYYAQQCYLGLIRNIGIYLMGCPVHTNMLEALWLVNTVS